MKFISHRFPYFSCTETGIHNLCYLWRWTNKKALISLLLKDTFLISVPLSHWNLYFSGYYYSQLIFNIIILHIKREILGKFFCAKGIKGTLFKIIQKIIYILYLTSYLFGWTSNRKSNHIYASEIFFRNFVFFCSAAWLHFSEEWKPQFIPLFFFL